MELEQPANMKAANPMTINLAFEISKAPTGTLIRILTNSDTN
jgi:hypothetical protein